MTINEQIVFGIFAVAMTLYTIVLILKEVRQWQARRSIISLRQLVVRIFGGMLMLMLLVMVLGGIVFVQLDGSPIGHFVVYWLACITLAMIIGIVALIDFCVVFRCRQRHRKLLREVRTSMMSYQQIVSQSVAPAPESADESYVERPL